MVPVQDLQEAEGADRAGGGGERREEEAAAGHPVGRRGREPAEGGRQHADGGHVHIAFRCKLKIDEIG